MAPNSSEESDGTGVICRLSAALWPSDTSVSQHQISQSKHETTLPPSKVFSSSSPHHDFLSAILQRNRLLAIHNLYFAFADTSNLVDAVSLLRFFGNPIAAPLYDLTFDDALRPLSTIPLDEIPHFLPSLPPPEAADFLACALGLHILLDQAPRYCLHGIDERWTLGFFGPLTLRFAQELVELPKALQPLRLQRWLDLGYSFEAAWLRAFSLSTAFIHMEDPDAQHLGQDLIEEGRKAAETHYGVTDPTRTLEEADGKDVTLFSKLVLKVLDGAEGLGREEAIWRMCRIVRVHEPIISVFGRYPYRNGALAREEKDREAAFLEETNNFGACKPETAKKIKEDAEAGRWTPLQGGRPQ